MAHILHIENRPADQAQIAQILREHLPEAVLSTVSDLPALQAALADDGPDLVLLSHDLPWIDGVTVLHTLKRHNPRLPVILVARHICEEDLASALRAGLESYVPKNADLAAHLPLAIARVIPNPGKG